MFMFSNQLSYELVAFLRVIHTGTATNNPGQAGVGIILSKCMGERVKGYMQVNERIIMLKLDTKPKDTVIIQTYLPTSSHDESERFSSMLRRRKGSFQFIKLIFSYDILLPLKFKFGEPPQDEKLLWPYLQFGGELLLMKILEYQDPKQDPGGGFITRTY
ncbi:hypothetical protein J437_LFUL011525 [Ladona fulva]|uniref:Uncharacterized protein n=1 Tax=Ladona fulva TaxID=123851 RepID=A0A8K0P2Z6_LADFU|nr:hypothetical protein J437_LFUL011525 [Ladona fulva]